MRAGRDTVPLGITASREPVTDTIAKALHWAEKLLSASDTPRLDAELLLAKTLNESRSFIIAYPDFFLTPVEIADYQQQIAQRVQKIPLAYLLGEKEFWSLPFIVTADVLIPRPETELLLEILLKDYQHCSELTIVDLGTGSGALAIALAHEQPHWHIIASDISQAALVVAQENARRLLKKEAHITFLHSDWLSDFPKNCYADVIISNPPYLAEDDPHLIHSEISHEPISALVAEEQGLAAYQKIATQARSRLTAGGRLYVEHGARQAEAVADIVLQAGFSAVERYLDLAGLPRVLRASM